MFKYLARGGLAAAVIFISLTATASWAQEGKDAILKARADFLTGYRAGNVEKIMDQFHENATFAGTLGPFWLVGKKAIGNLWRNYFAAWPDRDLSFRGQKGFDSKPELTFFNDGTMSIEVGYILMYMGSGKAPPVVTNIRYSITRTKTADGWLIANMNVSRIPGQ